MFLTVYIYYAQAPQKSVVKNQWSSDVVLSLDRARVSVCNATFILASVANALGQDPSQLALNKKSVHQARRQHRETAAHMIKVFDLDGPTGPLTVHWDGKILPVLTSWPTCRDSIRKWSCEATRCSYVDKWNSDHKRQVLSTSFSSSSKNFNQEGIVVVANFISWPSSWPQERITEPAGWQK